MAVLYDPPSGWRYGFPKQYKPMPGESLADTLLRDGYPQHEIDNGVAKYCRFIGERDELEAMARRHVEGDNDNPPVAAQAQPAGVIDYANPITRLRAAGGFVYLGSPYSLYPDHDEAADIVAAAAAGLMAQGLVVYSPIVHGHHVSQQGDLPTSWEFWKAQCQPLIDAASALAVLKMDGWGKSVGLQYEIGEFRRAGKPVVFLDSEAGWRHHDVMDPIEAKYDREASRADWEYQFRKEQEAA